MSVAGRSGLEEVVSSLSDYLYRYVRRKADFLPEHPRNSPERARRLLDQVGRPDCRYPIIRVVGTKGKGSTAAILESILRASSYRSGLYTSPHLHTPRERVRVDGRLISRPAFAGRLRRLFPLLEGSLFWDDLGPATLFEGLTALSMAYFADHGAEVVVVEAGMGGRIDATHALTPLLVLLTPMALDHQIYLGNTLEAIAAEKAGAIPLGGVALSGPQPAEAWAVIEARCRELGADLIRVEEGTAVDVGLSGPHQVTNARLALAAVTALRERGWVIPEGTVQEGLRWVHWPGRLELVAGRPQIWVDGAHNPAAARALARALEVPDGRPPLIFVLGCSEDKDLPGIIAALAPLADGAVVTRAGHHRAVAPERLATLWQAQGVPVEVVPAVGPALQRARSWAGPAGRVCVSGSVFVVAEVREVFGLAVREPWPEPVTSSPCRRPPQAPAR